MLSSSGYYIPVFIDNMCTFCYIVLLLISGDIFGVRYLSFFLLCHAFGYLWSEVLITFLLCHAFGYLWSEVLITFLLCHAFGFLSFNFKPPMHVARMCFHSITVFFRFCQTASYFFFFSLSWCSSIIKSH